MKRIHGMLETFFRKYEEFEGKYRNFRNGVKILGNISNFRNTRHPAIAVSETCTRRCNSKRFNTY